MCAFYSYLGSDEHTLGERTPVKPRMTEYIPPQWQICHVARQFKAAVAGPGVRETLEVKRVVERKDGTFDYGEWCVGSIVTVLPAIFLPCPKTVPMPSLRTLAARYGACTKFCYGKRLNTRWAVYL